VAEQLADTVLSLPMGPHLREEQVEQVLCATRQALEEIGVKFCGQSASCQGAPAASALAGSS